MTKKKRKKKDRNSKSISKKILSSAQQLLKAKVNISEWRNAKITAEEYQKTVISADELSKLDPVHGVYTYGQNKLSVFVELKLAVSYFPAIKQFEDRLDQGALVTVDENRARVRVLPIRSSKKWMAGKGI